MKESTVRSWVTTYQKRLDSLHREGKPLTVSVLSEKSRGRPLLIGSELEEHVKSFVGQMRSSGAVVNSAIARAAAKGIILAKDANLLEENGGGINLTKDPSSQPHQKGHLCYVSPWCKAMFIPPLLMCLSLRCCPYLLIYMISAQLAKPNDATIFLAFKLILVIGYINPYSRKFSSAGSSRKFSHENFQVHGMQCQYSPFPGQIFSHI